MTLEVNSQAPDFTLSDQDGNSHTLSSFKGNQPVVLVFIPFAFTGVCTGEVCNLSENLDQFNSAGIQLFAVNCDRAPSNKAWADQEGLKFPVLSDGWPHGEVSKAYDCFNEDLGCAMRRTVVVDAEGTVAQIFDSGDLGTPRQLAEYEEAIGKLVAV